MEILHLETLMWAMASVGLRVSAVMLFAPFFSSQAFPVPVKATLTVAVTVLLYPVTSGVTRVPTDWLRLLAGEFAIGLVLGLALQFIVEGAQTAGQLLGMQAGYSLVTMLDPQTQADTPVLASLHQMVALLIFLQLNVHHWLLRGLAASFAYLKPGAMVWREEIGVRLLHAAGGIWLAAFQMAAPAIMATMLVDIALGFLAKASPQLPVLFLGLPVKTVLSLGALAGTLVLWPQFFEQRFAAGISLGEHLLHLAG
jgi:flagellar biosynthesis protein FliR